MWPVDDLVNRPLADVLDAVAAPTPAPGGGSSSALGCALAAALVEMAAGIGGASEAVERAGALRARALALAEEELGSYAPVLEARRLPAGRSGSNDGHEGGARARLALAARRCRGGGGGRFARPCCCRRTRTRPSAAMPSRASFSPRPPPWPPRSSWRSISPRSPTRRRSPRPGAPGMWRRVSGETASRRARPVSRGSRAPRAARRPRSRRRRAPQPSSARATPARALGAVARA